MTQFEFMPIVLSLKVATFATALSFLTATPLAYFLVKKNIWGKMALETIFTLPLVLPPVVTGYFLLIVMSTNLFLKQALFTLTANIAAAFIVSFPLMYLNAKNAFFKNTTRYEELAYSLKKSKTQTFLLVTIPLAKNGLIAGAILTFARSLGEFGATILVAGNIEGLTQTIPLAIYQSVETGDNHATNQYVLIITLISFLVLALSTILNKRGSHHA